MRQKVLLLLALAFLLLFTSACGGSKTEKEAEPDKASVTETDNKAAEPAGKSQFFDGLQKSVSLPEKYPSDIFPVYEGSYIFQVLEADGGYTVVAYSKDDVKKVISFYENILKDAKPAMETREEESLTSFGSKGGYTYQLDVGKSKEMEGYNTSIGIMLNPEKEQ